MKKLNVLALVIVFGVLISGCENANIFSWTHSGGRDKSVESLLVDAEKALYDENYEEAIEYYNEILDKDPDNSDALYGLAAAELKNAGFDIANLIPKLLDDESVETDLIDLNYASIASGTEEAKNALKQIADGQADGAIPADDFDVNLNLGIALTLHAASSLLAWADANDDVTVDIKEDYSIVIVCPESKEDLLETKLEKAKVEVEEAINYLEVAGVISDTNIDDIKKGFESFINKINAETDKL